MKKLLLLTCVVALTGCSWLYPSMMLKTPRNYPFAKLNDSISSTDYKISANDFLSLRLYSQDGFRLIDYTNIVDNASGGTGGPTGNSSNTGANSVQYLVEPDGTVRLPVLGRIPIVGYTIREAVQMLEQKFSQYYIKPFIILSVTNRRVIIFPGNPGTAKVVPLINNNTTLIEVLALTGGITEDGKAKKIKLIRGNPNKPNVYMIDLSTIDGIKDGSTIMQEGDIIYVSPQIRPVGVILDRITPTLTLLSTILLTFTLLKSNKVF
ncbi:MAG TPA: polysaccharide biosynthesis/export family protein [Bacteroidia bacterium]|jgi:polysaccharide export outer membrane protein|nr:polysaccharide biosynthesis/export family protein [Bacteroidia bacterium]